MTQASDETIQDESETTQHSTNKYKVFHNKGRWLGLPLRVEDTGAAPRFEPLFDADQQPATLAFGVPNHGMMAGQPTNVYMLGYVADDARSLALVDTGDIKTRPAYDPAQTMQMA